MDDQQHLLGQPFGLHCKEEQTFGRVDIKEILCFFALIEITQRKKSVSSLIFMFVYSQALLDEAAGLGWDLAATNSEILFINLSNCLKHHCCRGTQLLIFTFC